LTAGEKTFPVSCSVADAPLLQQRAGAEMSRFKTTIELLPVPTEDEALAELLALNATTVLESPSDSCGGDICNQRSKRGYEMRIHRLGIFADTPVTVRRGKNRFHAK
jgi:hypothetical protein